LQALHAAAEHHVGLRRVLFAADALKKLIGSALHDLDPDAGTRFKFLDDGPPDLFFVRGIEDEPLRVAGCKAVRRLHT
jgi:hypothetical protein